MEWSASTFSDSPTSGRRDGVRDRHGPVDGGDPLPGHQEGPGVAGKTVVNLFFEASTRTRTSFEMAGKRLSADVVNFSARLERDQGETLLDTAGTSRR